MSSGATSVAAPVTAPPATPILTLCQPGSMAARAELVYRSRTFSVIGSSLIAFVAVIAMTVIAARPSPSWFWVPVVTGAATGAMWLLYRCYLAPRVVATDGGVLVVNPFARTALRWWDVERFESRPMFTVVRRDGTTVSAWALPHPSSGRLVGRASLGEPVEVALTRQLAVAKLPPDRPVPDPTDAR
jgi:hypothetical protein